MFRVEFSKHFCRDSLVEWAHCNVSMGDNTNQACLHVNRKSIFYGQLRECTAWSGWFDQMVNGVRATHSRSTCSALRMASASMAGKVALTISR